MAVAIFLLLVTVQSQELSIIEFQTSPIKILCRTESSDVCSVGIADPASHTANICHWHIDTSYNYGRQIKTPSLLAGLTCYYNGVCVTTSEPTFFLGLLNLTNTTIRYLAVSEDILYAVSVRGSDIVASRSYLPTGVKISKVGSYVVSSQTPSSSPSPSRVPFPGTVCWPPRNAEERACSGWGRITSNGSCVDCPAGSYSIFGLTCDQCRAQQWRACAVQNDGDGDCEYSLSSFPNCEWGNATYSCGGRTCYPGKCGYPYPNVICNHCDSFVWISPSPSPSWSASSSVSSSSSRTLSLSQTASISPSRSPSASSSESLSLSSSLSKSASTSMSASLTVSTTQSGSASVSPSRSQSATGSQSSSASGSGTSSLSSSGSRSSSDSKTPSASRSQSPTNSISGSGTVSKSESPTSSLTTGASPSNSASGSPSPSLSSSTTTSPTSTESESGSSSETSSITESASSSLSSSRSPNPRKGEEAGSLDDCKCTIQIIDSSMVYGDCLLKVDAAVVTIGGHFVNGKLSRDNTTFIYELPEHLSGKTYDMAISVFSSECSQVKQLRHYARKVCYSHDCVFCGETFGDLRCYQSRVVVSLAILVLSFGASLLLLSLCYFQRTLSAIAIILSMLVKAFSKAMALISSGCLRLSVNMRSRYKKVPTEQEVEPLREVATGSSVKPKRFSAALGLLLFCPGCLGCTNHVIVPFVPLNQCVTDLNERRCHAEMAGLFQFTAVNQEQCLTIYEADKQMFSQKIVIVGLREKLRLKDPYFTSEWERNDCNKYNCPDDHCSKVGITAVNTHPLDLMSSDHRHGCDQWPSYSQASTGPSGWGKGCFIASNGCNYNAMQIHPRGKIYKVREIIDSQFEIQVSVDGTLTPYFSDSSRVGNWTLEVFDIQKVFTEKRSLIEEVSTDNRWIAEACDVGNPCTHLIGDLQSISNTYTTPSREAFVFSTDIIVSYSSVSKGAAFTTKSPSATRFASQEKTSVPGSEFDKMIVYDKGSDTLFFQRSTVGRLSLSLKSDGEYNFVYEADACCPEIGDLLLTGFYPLESGAVLEMGFKNTCGKKGCTLAVEGDCSDAVVPAGESKPSNVSLTCWKEEACVTVKASGYDPMGKLTKTQKKVCGDLASTRVITDDLGKTNRTDSTYKKVGGHIKTPWFSSKGRGLTNLILLAVGGALIFSCAFAACIRR